MRKLILTSVALVALAGATTLKANTINQPIEAVNVVQDSSSRTPVKPEELPEAVKTTLQSEPYKAWTPTAAFLVKPAQGTEYYEITVRKEQEETSLKIDKDGKIVE